MIGIIGGMGPHAGLNLFNCILDHTPAEKDQDHLPVVLWSSPDEIGDRSEYLAGKIQTNPGVTVAGIARKIYELGITVIGIPCNTFHASPIWSVFISHIQEINQQQLEVVSMIRSTTKMIAEIPTNLNVGILGTLGTYNNNIYGDALRAINVDYLVPSDSWKNKVHQSIYDLSFGIKAQGKISEQTLHILKSVVADLVEKGANSFILGCTELSTIPREIFNDDIIVIDPLQELAKTLISTYQQKSKLLL